MLENAIRPTMLVNTRGLLNRPTSGWLVVVTLLLMAGYWATKLQMEQARLSAQSIVAAESGDTRLLRELVGRGVDINKAREAHTGATALMRAAQFKRKDAVLFLLRAGADPNGRAPDGTTALSLLQPARSYSEIIAILKSYGARE